jgi:hypothetical protein
VADRVEIEVDGRYAADDLLRALAVRGLPGAFRPGENRHAVVLDCPRESTASLLRDLLPALEEWRLDRGRDPLRITIEGRPYTLSNDAELECPPGEPTALALTA